MPADPDLPIARPRLCEAIVDAAGEAILFADVDGIVRLWNDAAETIFGYAREDALGSSLDIIVPAEYREAHWRGYERALERGAVTSPPVTRTRVPAVTADDTRIEIETSGARVVTDGSGDPLGVFNLIRDVSTSSE